MKKIIFFFVFFLSITSSQSKDSIIFIDLEKIINESDIGKSTIKEINTFNNENNEKFKKRLLDLQNKEANLAKQQNIISEEEFNTRLKNLKKEIDLYNKDNEERLENQKLNLIQKRAELLNLFQPIFSIYMKNNNINYILNDQIILMGKEDLNKTLELLEIVNKNVIIKNSSD
jgi:outer membrane protein